MLFEIDEYIEGFQIHRNHLSKDRQIAILEACRRVIKANPLWRPKFAGRDFVSDYALENTNCGRLGWLADEKGFYYSEKDINGYRWQPIPNEILEVVNEFAPVDYIAENCLINFYQDRKEDNKVKKSKLGLHQDRTEKDLTAPIISISIGQAAIFQIGGLTREDKVSEIQLVSGDVVVMAGKSRNAFHGVKELLPGTCPVELGMKTEARINITIRQVNPLPPAEYWQNDIKDIGLEAFKKEVQSEIKAVDDTKPDFEKRDDFQRKFSAETIKQLEVKMLPSFGLRTKEDAPAKALTPEERLIYADYLDSKGQPKGAASFRNYVEPKDEKPTI